MTPPRPAGLTEARLQEYAAWKGDQLVYATADEVAALARELLSARAELSAAHLGMAEVRADFEYIHHEVYHSAVCGYRRGNLIGKRAKAALDRIPLPPSSTPARITEERLMTDTAKIVTEHVYPPIPLRQFDWCAHYDDPEGPRGWGRTEAEAVQDLTESHPREHSESHDPAAAARIAVLENAALILGDRRK